LGNNGLFVPGKIYKLKGIAPSEVFHQSINLPRTPFVGHYEPQNALSQEIDI
jgi:hypothetical protein